jgi:hypothetical protein
MDRKRLNIDYLKSSTTPLQPVYILLDYVQSTNQLTDFIKIKDI